MVKCDVCGKSSLLPEKFGATNVCKICFVKVKGLLWKHQYERSEDAEKQRCKVLETVQKHNFPQFVIDSINDFFVNQMNSMICCDCCGQPVQHLQSLGSAQICKQCFGKINNSAWKETEYDDNESVEKNRQKILKIANKNSFTPVVIDGINMHFNTKIQKGLISTIYGVEGQKLKVFDTYCILTTNDKFDVETLSLEYGAILKSNQPKESFITNSDAKRLVKSVMTGGIVKTGISLAASAAINAATDAMIHQTGTFKVIKGDFRIDYMLYSSAEYQKCKDNEVGFIRFMSNNPSNDLVFFFNSDKKKIDEAYNAITNGISISKQSIPIPTPIESSTTIQQPVQSTIQQSSVADEILKFKNLLDIGAITQEEFDTKKKELLNL